MLFAFGGVVAWLWRDAAGARDVAVTQQGKAEAAKAGEAKHRDEAEKARDKEKIARGDAERARDKEKVARDEAEKAGEREKEAHAETGLALGREKVALGKLAAQDALRKVDLAHAAAVEGHTLRSLRLLIAVRPADRQWEWRYVARLARPEFRRLVASERFVHNVVLSRDGRRAFASAEECVRVWEPDTGKELTAYRGHAATVRYVAVHPDGERVVSASEDGAVHI